MFLRPIATSIAALVLLGKIVTMAAPQAAKQVQGPDPVLFFDLTPLFDLDLKDEAQRQRFYDESHLVFALQGLVNRTAPHLFVRYLKEPDDFWWGQMTQPGGWLSGRYVERVTSLDDLLERCKSFYRAAVVWDERVSATANLASTIAGCDDLLPLRFDLREGSLYRRLSESGPRLVIKASLLRSDGTALFTGHRAV